MWSQIGNKILAFRPTPKQKSTLSLILSLLSEERSSSITITSRRATSFKANAGLDVCSSSTIKNPRILTGGRSLTSEDRSISATIATSMSLYSHKSLLKFM